MSGNEEDIRGGGERGGMMLFNDVSGWIRGGNEKDGKEGGWSWVGQGRNWIVEDGIADRSRSDDFESGLALDVSGVRVRFVLVRDGA